MPLGLILTAVIVLALYAGLTFVASGILSIDEMATSVLQSHCWHLSFQELDSMQVQLLQLWQLLL